VRDVTASRVVGYNGVTAQAVVRYRMADGRRIRELTQFTLAPEHGTLKIAATNVISSVTH
jgi:hypothetical protein